MKNENTILCLFIVFIMTILTSCNTDQQKVDLKMIHVPAGSFIMGDTSGNWDEVPVHKVKITQPFLISETEVTTAIYKHFNPAYQFTDEKYAVGVSWYEATDFCKWLSEKEGIHYRLPTESEWEYVCGLRDSLGVKNMLDSTQEWCSDWHGAYPQAPQTNPVGIVRGMAKVVRGGLLDDFIKEYSHPESFYYRKSNRSGMAPAFTGYTVPVEFTNSELSARENQKELNGLAGIVYDDTEMTAPLMLFPVPNINSTGYKWISMNNFSVKWVGLIKAPYTGIVTIEAQYNNKLSVEISGESIINGKGNDKSISGSVTMVEGEEYPVIIKYVHDGGESILNLWWSWARQEEKIIPASAFVHREKDKIQLETEYKKGVFNRYVKPSIGFRLVQAEDRESQPLAYEAPFVQQCVKSFGNSLCSRPVKPYFQKRYLHPIPPSNSNKEEIIMSGLHPSIGGHNHHSAPVVCPNGDLLTVYFSATFEDDPEVCLIASRLRYGADEWDLPEPIMDFPDVNDVSALFWQNEGKIYLFWGNIHLKGGYPFQWVESTDNGATFSEVKYPVIESVVDGYTPQPITSIFKDKEGIIYLAADGVGAHSFLWASNDGGKTWFDTGGRTGGRHTAIVPLKNGDFYGVGGKKSEIDGFMPISVSSDKGKSWKVTKSEFPALGGGQRPALIRLKSGRLLYAGDYQHKDGLQPEGIIGKGAFVAISENEGETWHVKTIPGTHKSIKEKTLKTMKAGTIGYVSLVQGENDMIHLTTSENAPALHFEFNEAWILEGKSSVVNNERLMNSTAAHISDKETYEEYYANGNIKLRYGGGIANDGRFLLDGKEEWFYPDGTIKYTAVYKLGKKTDTERYFSSNGMLTWERFFQGNEFTWRQYWENGKPKSESQWKNMKCEGESKRWSTGGTLIKKVTFNKGHISDRSS